MVDAWCAGAGTLAVLLMRERESRGWTDVHIRAHFFDDGSGQVEGHPHYTILRLTTTLTA